jgi:hypothetical protein
MVAINGAIRERTWGRREREGRGGFWLGRRTGAERGARGARARRSAGAGKERREGEEKGGPGGPHLAVRGSGRGNGARPAGSLVGPRLGLGFYFLFSFLFKNINKYIFKNSKNHNNYTKIIYN